MSQHPIRALIGAEPFDPQAGTDLVLARWALARLEPALRYAADADTWLLRGDESWANVGKDFALTAVIELAHLMPSGSPEAEKGSKERLRLERRARFTSKRGASDVAGMMRAVARSPASGARVLLSDLDNDPEILWAGGRAWNLRHWPYQLDDEGAPDSATPHLHTASVTPRKQATPRWDELVRLVWPDAEVREWALNVLAVALTGYPAAVLPILCGKEGRGKSSVVSLLMRCLGTYGDSVSPKLLSGAEGHASIVYALKGLRLAFIDEGPRGGQVATEALKALTGGTKLTGNRMRENPVTFVPTHTLVLTCNEPPSLTDPAIRRRVKLIPCDSSYPEAIAEVMCALGPDGPGSVWEGEAPGVLADMMRRAAAWLRNRASIETAPAVVAELVQEIAAEQDPIVQWVAEETEKDATGTKAGDLYAAFVAWCKGHNVKNPPSKTAWGRKLNDLGHERDKRGGGVVYRPLRLQALGLTPLRIVPGMAS